MYDNQNNDPWARHGRSTFSENLSLPRLRHLRQNAAG